MSLYTSETIKNLLTYMATGTLTEFIFDFSAIANGLAVKYTNTHKIIQYLVENVGNEANINEDVSNDIIITL